MFQNEQWRQIDEFPHYMVSQYGRVKRADQPDEKARKISISHRGFPVITLYADDSKSRYLRQINLLVARAWLLPPQFPDMTAVWHIDGNLKNVFAANLKWAMRSHVLEWNDMHRRGKPAYKTPRVKNNRTGVVYANAYECAMSEGELETKILWRIERQARHPEDDEARYRYLFAYNDPSFEELQEDRE